MLFSDDVYYISFFPHTCIQTNFFSRRIHHVILPDNRNSLTELMHMSFEDSKCPNLFPVYILFLIPLILIYFLSLFL